MGVTPLVALESTVIAHGLPYPHNRALAQEMETIVAAQGAQPRTIAVLQGELVAGINLEQLQHLATAASLAANLALLKNNARVAGQIAIALSEGEEKT